MVTQKGTVTIISGSVTAKAPNGNERALGVGNQVIFGEIISTEIGGYVEIVFADGSVMDLTGEHPMTLNNEFLDLGDAVSQVKEQEAGDTIATMQQALLDDHDPMVFSATTAGIQDDGNEGHSPVFVEYLGSSSVLPESGFETRGTGEEDPIFFVDKFSSLLEVESESFFSINGEQKETSSDTESLDLSDLLVDSSDDELGVYFSGSNVNSEENSEIGMIVEDNPLVFAKAIIDHSYTELKYLIDDEIDLI